MKDDLDGTRERVAWLEKAVLTLALLQLGAALVLCLLALRVAKM